MGQRGRHPPDPRVAIDLAAHLALLPPGATCKGLFFSNLFEQAKAVASPEELALRAGVPHRRYVPFFDYSFADHLRLAVTVAEMIHPSKPVSQGVRELAATTYGTLLGTHFGRVIFSALGVDLGAALLAGPRAYKLVVNFGKVSAALMEPRYVRYEFRDFPALIETQQVGIIEGALAHYDSRGHIELELRDLANATLHVHW